jgi:hypothetical protein
MTNGVRPGGLIVCGLMAVWLGWLELERRVGEAESDASDASYAASDASSKADEANRLADEAKSLAEEAELRSRYSGY